VQGALLGRLLCLACAGTLAALAAPAGGAATAQVTVEVPAGETRTVRLRKLPRGAVIGVSVVVSGRLRIALVSALQLKSDKPEALFRGSLERRLSFRVVIPESSDYYLVLDNRSGDTPVKTTATVRAEKKASPPAPKVPPGQGASLEGTRAAARPAG
jgi:hypothetical protein